MSSRLVSEGDSGYLRLRAAASGLLPFPLLEALS